MQPLVPPMPPPGGTDPYKELLDQLTVSFTVSPSTIPVCAMSQSVQFKWQVTGPDVGDQHIHFTLVIGTNRFSVGPVGSQSVQYSSPIAFPIAFVFYAEYRDDRGYIRATRTLEIGSITAAPSPNSGTCSLTTQQVAVCENPSLKAQVSSRISQYGLQLKGEPGWAIDAAGIYIHLSLAWPTGPADLTDISVDATVLPVLHQGQPSFVLVNLNVQANFPDWAKVLDPLGVAGAWLFINTVLIPSLSPQFAGWVQQAINNLPLDLQLLQSTGCVIAQVQLLQNAIAFSLCCPPFIVNKNDFQGSAGVQFYTLVAKVDRVYCMDPADYIALIDWGDGTAKTNGMLYAVKVQGPPCPNVPIIVEFLVFGTHTYATASIFTVTITVTREGETASGTATATIG